MQSSSKRRSLALGGLAILVIALVWWLVNGGADTNPAFEEAGRFLGERRRAN